MFVNVAIAGIAGIAAVGAVAVAIDGLPGRSPDAEPVAVSAAETAGAAETSRVAETVEVVETAAVAPTDQADGLAPTALPATTTTSVPTTTTVLVTSVPAPPAAPADPWLREDCPADAYDASGHFALCLTPERHAQGSYERTPQGWIPVLDPPHNTGGWLMIPDGWSTAPAPDCSEPGAFITDDPILRSFTTPDGRWCSLGPDWMPPLPGPEYCLGSFIVRHDWLSMPGREIACGGDYASFPVDRG